MRRKTKVVTMLVTVRVPSDMTTAEARREVRTLINHQTTFAAEHGDVWARSVGRAPKAPPAVSPARSRVDMVDQCEYPDGPSECCVQPGVRTRTTSQGTMRLCLQHFDCPESELFRGQLETA